MLKYTKKIQMDNFIFYSPTEFVFEKERENETGEYVKKFGGTRVLIHYGSGSAVRSGLLDRVKKSLDDEGIFLPSLAQRKRIFPHLSKIRASVTDRPVDLFRSALTILPRYIILQQKLHYKRRIICFFGCPSIY